MISKFRLTLHWYILKELLRVFLMTAGALTTLMAFGGTFKQVAKEGVEVWLLLRIMADTMPAMLAYAIPIAALFAAVLVYWRLSTDNELTACRASGISYWAVLGPALVLGVAVGLVDLVFVNWVVPTFWQKTERLVRQDIGSLVVGTLRRGEKFKDPSTGRLLIYANDSTLLPSTGDPHVTQLELRGMLAVYLKKDGTRQGMVAAVKATATLTDLPDTDETQVTFDLKGAEAQDVMKTFQGDLDMSVFSGSGPPMKIPSMLRDKPKFSNWEQLQKLSVQQWRYAPMKDQLDKLFQMERYLQLGKQMLAIADSTPGPVKRLVFTNEDGCSVEVLAPRVSFLPDEPKRMIALDRSPAKAATATMAALAGTPVTVRVYERPKLVRGVLTESIDTEYQTDVADIVFDTIELDSGETKSVTTATLSLRGNNVFMENKGRRLPRRRLENITTKESGEFAETLTSLQLPAGMRATNDPFDYEHNWYTLLENAKKSDSLAVRKLAVETNETLLELDHTINSELHGRGSFAVSCLTLVLFGAALGVMLRGRNPLAVFVVGFMPSILLVLLITMGRRVMENAYGNQPLGLALLWAGNGVLLVLVVVTYTKLMRT